MKQVVCIALMMVACLAGCSKKEDRPATSDASQAQPIPQQGHATANAQAFVPKYQKPTW